MLQPAAQPTTLRRDIGLFGAIFMGLGSIIGTGVFVSIGIAADISGPSVVLAIAIAAIVATFNGLNSAQLAANHPVSGGTYEYGYRYLNPAWGFTAGWTFLMAKSASAATAALGFAAYVQSATGFDGRWYIPLALATVGFMTLIVLGGIRRSNTANTIIVSITLVALALFIVAGLPTVELSRFTPFFDDGGSGPLSNFLQATALMFVAYTGYGRIATLGEEVKEPRRTIPRAIIGALWAIMGIYVLVAFVSVGNIGAVALEQSISDQRAPLETTARAFGNPLITPLISLGAMTAMLSVLLNLILGLSRVLLAMGRRKDAPPIFAKLNQAGTTPIPAVIAVGVGISLLVLTGNVRATWSFSAFTVLVYYAITNLAALQLPPQARLFPRSIAYLGLAACSFLAIWVEPPIWISGCVLIIVGLIWQHIAKRVFT